MPIIIPHISVIVAVYNGVAHLGEQMDALLAQDCDFPWEAVYVDNGSTDGSRELISRRIAEDHLAHVRLVDGSQRRGQVHARNVGSQHARADLLAFTDQDDLPAPGWLAGMRRALDRAEAVAGYVLTSPFGYPPPEDRNESPIPDYYTLKVCGFDWAGGTNIGIHRHVLKDVGFWQDVGVHAGEDVDLWIRLQLAGKNYVQAMDARVTWRARIGLRNLFWQGFTYGRSEVLIYRRYRDRGAHGRSLITSLRGIKQTLAALGGFFHTPRSYLGIHKLGFLCGRATQSIRSRVFYI